MLVRCVALEMAKPIVKLVADAYGIKKRRVSLNVLLQYGVTPQKARTYLYCIWERFCTLNTSGFPAGAAVVSRDLLEEGVALARRTVRAL